MENSILSDAAGVQKNIAKMYEEYARSVGKSTESLTQSEKAQAVYNGIMEETQFQLGNAAKYAEEFAGTQAKLQASQIRLNLAYGEAITGGLIPFIAALAGGTDLLGEFTEKNTVLVAVLTVVSLGLASAGIMAGLSAVAIKLLGLEAIAAAGGVGIFSASMKVLSATMSTAWAAMGPAGWIILGITALVAVIAGVSTAMEQAKKKTEELRKEISALSEDNRGASKLIDEYEELSTKTYRTAEETQRMLDIRAELVKTYGYSVSAVDNEGRLLAGNLELMKEQLETSKKLMLTKLQENQGNDEEAYNDALRKRADILKDIENVQKDIDNPGKVLGADASAEDVEYYVGLWRDKMNGLYNDLEKGEATSRAAIGNMIQAMVLEVEASGKDVPDAVQQVIVDKINSSLQMGLDYDSARAVGQDILDAYLSIDAATVKSSIEEIEALKQQVLASLLSTGDIEIAQTVTDQIIENLIGTDAQQVAFERAAELKRKIAEGLATQTEMEEFDLLTASILEDLQSAKLEITSMFDARSEGAQAAKDAVDGLTDSYSKSAKAIREEAVAAEAAKMKLEDAASSLRSVASANEQVSKSFDEVANMKAAVNAIQQYASSADTSAEAAKNAADAKEWLAQQYGVEASAIDSMLPSIEDDINMKEALALADYAVGMQAAITAQAQITAMITAGNITEEQGLRMIAALQGVINKMAELGGSSVSIDGKRIRASKDIPTVSTTRSGGGGGGSSKNAALDREIAQLEHKKALDQVTTAEEIANLERILAQYAKTTAEKMDLTEKLYALRKKKAEEDLEYQKSMDQLTLREEIDRYEAMIATFAEGTAPRQELELKRYEAIKELERQEYDLKVYYGQLTLEQQAEELEKMISQYKEGTSARIELEKQAYDVQQQIRQRDIDNLNDLTNAVTSALEARYNEQREKEEARLKESSSAWQKWGDEQVAAIRKQIDALDEQSQGEDRAEQERKKRREIAMLEQAAMYETDAYNRKKIEEQIALKKDDLNKWIAKNERDDLKKSLNAQIDAVNETVEAEKQKVQEQLEANDKYFDGLTSAENLKNEALALLMQGGQEQLVTLLQSYAPEYDATGQTLGEKLYDGFMSKVGAIGTWFDGLVEKFDTFKADIASVASTAAVKYRSNATTQPVATTAGTQSAPPQITMNFNSPVTSPTEIRREVERLADFLSKI